MTDSVPAVNKRVSKIKKSLSRLGLTAALLLNGCGTMKNGRGWGQDVTFLPGGQTLANAAWTTARTPEVLVPLAGSLLSLIALDEAVSRWAAGSNPIFGSQRTASDRSDDFLLATEWIWLTTLVFTPSGSEAGEIVFAKSKGSIVELGAVSATKNLTVVLKTTTDRSRPNRSDTRSFPSGHTSSAFAYSKLARKNLEAISLPEKVKTLLDLGFLGVAVGTAWARVEANAHYPGDVFFGAAFGNFLAGFFTEAFMGTTKDSFSLSVRPAPGGAVLQWRFRF